MLLLDNRNRPKPRPPHAANDANAASIVEASPTGSRHTRNLSGQHVAEAAEYVHDVEFPIGFAGASRGLSRASSPVLAADQGEILRYMAGADHVTLA